MRDAQLLLFVFLAAVAAGTFVGGPIGDRVGRKAVIWVSILGVLPFTLALPYANLFWTAVLSVDHRRWSSPRPSRRSSSMPSSWCPAGSGMISGLFFGFAFGIGRRRRRRCSASLADAKGILFVYQVCAFLPLLGLLTVFLPPTARSSAAERRGDGD